MQQELFNAIQERITVMGLKKKYLAARMGIDPVRFSQVLAGKRKLKGQELRELKLALGLD
jgi:antitoxin component HigA of HigAB toxin-antitoxin module